MEFQINVLEKCMIIKRTIKAILAKYGYKLIRVMNPENEAYYCRALTGMSGNSISINSDLSVS